MFAWCASCFYSLTLEVTFPTQRQISIRKHVTTQVPCQSVPRPEVLGRGLQIGVVAPGLRVGFFFIAVHMGLSLNTASNCASPRLMFSEAVVMWFHGVPISVTVHPSQAPHTPQILNAHVQHVQMLQCRVYRAGPCTISNKASPQQKAK